ncbi:MAG: lactate racemase domain-containing protein, partial [Victivallaceae bacterium]|nr:lactate racemase domain-containing protein [Victivallaceae bacterium]
MNSNLSDSTLESMVVAAMNQALPPGARSILLLPPDHTRLQSKAGEIVRILYRHFSQRCRIDIMPALGTHAPMTGDDLRLMFGTEIPQERFLVHDWRRDTVRLGEIPAQMLRELSGGALDFPVAVEVNGRILDPRYDLVVS